MTESEGAAETILLGDRDAIDARAEFLKEAWRRYPELSTEALLHWYSGPCGASITLEELRVLATDGRPKCPEPGCDVSGWENIIPVDPKTAKT